MGANFDVLFIGMDKSTSLFLFNSVAELVLDIEKMLNCFDTDSEVYRLNERDSLHSLYLSNKLFDIISECISFNQLTDGYFDISLGDANSFYLSKADNSFHSDKTDLKLDFGGYAKGYALKMIKEYLLSFSVKHAFVNFGNSSILSIGNHPLSSSWPVSIANPYNTDQILDTVQLKDISLSVSGNMPSHTSHIFNPHTCNYILDSKIALITASDPLVAEILSTVAMIADPSTFKIISEKFNIINHTNYDCCK